MKEWENIFISIFSNTDLDNWPWSKGGPKPKQGWETELSMDSDKFLPMI